MPNLNLTNNPGGFQLPKSVTPTGNPGAGGTYIPPYAPPPTGEYQYGVGGWIPKLRIPGDFDKLQNGNDFLAVIMEMLNNGLPQDVMEYYQRKGQAQIQGTYEAGKQNLSQQMAKNKGVNPLGLGAYGNLELSKQRQAGVTELQDKMAMAKQQGKTTAFDLYSKLYNIILGKDQTALQKYMFDEENKFSFFDDILAPLFGAGASGFGAYLGKKIS